jgi:hypothetical protein
MRPSTVRSPGLDRPHGQIAEAAVIGLSNRRGLVGREDLKCGAAVWGATAPARRDVGAGEDEPRVLADGQDDQPDPFRWHRSRMGAPHGRVLHDTAVSVEDRHTGIADHRTCRTTNVREGVPGVAGAGRGAGQIARQPQVEGHARPAPSGPDGQRRCSRGHRSPGYKRRLATAGGDQDRARGGRRDIGRETLPDPAEDKAHGERGHARRKQPMSPPPGHQAANWTPASLSRCVARSSRTGRVATRTGLSSSTGAILTQLLHYSSTSLYCSVESRSAKLASPGTTTSRCGNRNVTPVSRSPRGPESRARLHVWCRPRSGAPQCAGSAREPRTRPRQGGRRAGSRCRR